MKHERGRLAPLLLGTLVLVAACGDPPAGGAPGGGGPGPAAISRKDGYCSTPGLPKALRQTIVVIDENEVHAAAANGGMAPENLQWSRWLGRLVSPENVSRTFGPRERLTVLFARKDGSEPQQVFTGCLPTFSAAEVKMIRQKQGGVGGAISYSFGSGVLEQAQKDLEPFSNALGAAVTLATAPDRLSKTAVGSADFAQSGLMISLLHGVVSDPKAGAPRIVILSDMSRFSAPEGDVIAARKAAFALASSTPLDLKRADVYVVGVQPGAGGERFRTFADAYLLGSAGALRGWGLSDVPMTEPAPDHVQVLSGTAHFGGQDLPVRVRLGTTDDGRLASTWISMRGRADTSTPVSGEVVSDPAGGRLVRADGKALGQLWAFNPDPEPEWRPDMAFGGLRGLELRVAADGSATGKVFDPEVGVMVGNDKPYIVLKLAPDPGADF